MKRLFKKDILRNCVTVVLLLVLYNCTIHFIRYKEDTGTPHHINYKVTHANNVLTTTTTLTTTRGEQNPPLKNLEESDDKILLEMILNISESAKHEAVQQLPGRILKRFLKLPSVEYSYEIAILTPVRNAAGALKRFGDEIGKLTYPKHLISLFFGEDGSSDNTFEEANATAYNLRKFKKLNSTDVVRLNISGGYMGLGTIFREYGRAHMALARNRLVRFALSRKKFDYVLWINSDIVELPLDLIQQMLFAKSDVVATCCLMRSAGYKMKYDRNSWRETNASIKYQSNLKPDTLVMEGYRKSFRQQLPDLKSEGRIVKLDGVGGCALMIKADCHRSGLHFPEVVYKHHIETEGLAKLAHDMGYDVVGLPFVEVFHA